MPHDGLRQTLSRPGSILMSAEFARAGGHGMLLLSDPAETISTTRPEQVPEILDTAERWQNEDYRVAGFVGYEAGAAFGLPNHPPGDDIPLAWFAAYPASRAIELPPDALRPDEATPVMEDVEVALNVGEEEYTSAIARIKNLIASGDTYQVNYTCRASFEADIDPLDYFLAMARSHPVPYAAYVNLGNARILSMSPELFLQRAGNVLTSRPMKGTRGRGRTVEEDEALCRDLLTAEKDRAENLMIVDMVRNDIGRVAAIGSVHVPALFDAEKYWTVWQMTTTVTGEAPEEASLSEIFAATFPGASITGAPKHRTMEIIRELEPDPRGVYCGALGLLIPDSRDFTFNLPIRTLVHRDGQFMLGIGAGIVWDSDPHSEWEETLLKSQFAFRLEPNLRLFETMLLDEAGRFAYLDDHLRRLMRSAEYFDFWCDLRDIHDRLREYLEEADPPAVVRLELSADREVSLHTRPVPAPLDRPIRVLLSDRRTDASDRFLQHKTTHRRLYDEERARLEETDCDEVIFLNTDGHLTEGAITNAFLRFGEAWVTPPIGDGLLPGIWREHFVEHTSAGERSVTIDELRRADEIVVGNSVRGVLQVGEIVDQTTGEVIWRASSP